MTLATSCRGAHASAADGAGGADLQRDLDAAAASAAFAPPIRGDVPARFVSALELGASPDSVGPAHATAPRGHATGRARARRRTPPAVTLVRARHEPTSTAGEEVAEAEAAAAAAGAVEEVASASGSAGSGTYTAPVESAPASAPARAPRRGGGAWGVIGAVIRGGMVEIDRCDTEDERARRARREGRANDPRRRPPVYIPGVRPLPTGQPGVSLGGFVDVALGGSPDRPMGASPRRPGGL